jgi:Family of unknown function (DUF5715)
MVLLVVSPQLAAAGTVADGQAFVKALDKMMASLAPESARASAAITKVYRQHLDLLVLDAYSSLEGALATGGLVSLPVDPARFNLKPRVDGSSPIAEKDLGNQSTYLSARPETIGALLDIASRVTSGPVEITSLVRHREYQETLKTTNRNARTSVPTHTMGLAVDIALLNTPLKTVYEIRDVLRRMQAAGDLLVIGERKQLVFHVVPHPARLGHFMEVYANAVAAETPGANIIPATPVADTPTPLTPSVTAEIIAIRPVEELADEWWAANDSPSDLTIEVSPGTPASTRERPSFVAQVATTCVELFSGLFQRMRAIVS